MRPFQRTPLGRFVGWAGSKDADYWMMGVLHCIMGSLLIMLFGIIVAIPISFFIQASTSDQVAAESQSQHAVQCVDCNHAACEHGTCPSVCEACLPAKEETP